MLSPEREKELTVLSEELQDLIGNFLARASGTNVPAFKEFGYLMHEYLKVCRQSQANGVDWSKANHLTDPPLVAFPNSIQFVQEKIKAIFEPFAVVTVRARRDDEPSRK